MGGWSSDLRPVPLKPGMGGWSSDLRPVPLKPQSQTYKPQVPNLKPHQTLNVGMGGLSSDLRPKPQSQT